MELTLTQDGGVASGDGALGVLVGILAGQFRQDDLLDLVLYQVRVLTKAHTALECFELGDEFFGSLLFHGGGQRLTHALLILLEELTRRGEEDHEFVEPVLLLADQRCVAGPEDVVSVGLVVSVERCATSLVLLHIRGVQVAVDLGELGHGSPLNSSELTIWHRRSDLAERKVTLLECTEVAGFQQAQFDLVHSVTDFDVSTPLWALLSQVLEASKFLLLGDSLTLLVEGDVVGEAIAHLSKGPATQTFEAVNLWSVGYKLAIFHAEQGCTTQVLHLAYLGHVVALRGVEHLVDSGSLGVRDTTNFTSDGTVEDQTK